MKFTSLFSKITLIFILALFLFSGLFYIFIKTSNLSLHENTTNSYKKLSKYFHENRMKKNNLLNYLINRGFEEEKNFFMVLNKGEVVSSGRGFETIVFKNKYYFHVLTPGFKVLLKDTNREISSLLFVYIIFISIFILLIILYLWLISSLKPLFDLKKSIKEFSNGDLTVTCKSDKKDEIADVANEFDNAVNKIKLLMDSRQLFLRTVMHELKTPIAKGRIVSELVQEEKQKIRMINIFERLDFLINDFAKIEEILSKNFTVNKSPYFIVDIFVNSKKMLMKENVDKYIDFNISNDEKILADFELMSMVFKNLIDNALRYSSDSSLSIEISNKEINFISKGKKLEKDFQEYFLPFHNTTKSKTHGMGLGLYIIKSILDMHKYEFKYEYINKSNIFTIEL